MASEIDSNAVNVYKANWGIEPLGDITEFANEDSVQVPDHEVLVGGFPCQPFSLAGVSSRNHHGISHGLECTTQGTLFHDIVLIAKSTQPKALLLENVRNLASHDSGRTIAVILKQIQDAGYVVFPQNFGSKNWAILDSQSVSGQRRKRVYLVCIRKDIVRERGAFEFPVLSLSKSPITLRQVIEQDSTKGGDGKRIVQLDSETLRLVKDHRRRQIEERMKAGSLWQEANYIFTQENGLPLDPSTPYQLFKKTAKRLGLRSESLHSIRHLHATELLNSGAGVHLVKDRLGHSDISTTLRIYAHIRPEQKQEVADLFARAIENG